MILLAVAVEARIMYYHMATVNTACAPAVRHRLILIDWVQRGEDMLWTQELPLTIDDCGRQRIGFLLLNRLEAVAGAALDSLLQKKTERSQSNCCTEHGIGSPS